MTAIITGAVAGITIVLATLILKFIGTMYLSSGFYFEDMIKCKKSHKIETTGFRYFVSYINFIIWTHWDHRNEK